MKRWFQFLFLLVACLPALATHNRAGEITIRQVSGFTYEIYLVTYTYTLATVDRQELTVDWGDNTSSIVQRNGTGTLLPDEFKKNEYYGNHTFPGVGTYQIVMEDPNRNLGVVNIAGSVNIPFCIKTILQINTFLGQNSTPILLNAPLDLAAVGRRFVHNPGAFDPNGDSLSYALTVCLGEGALPIPDYVIPASSNKPIYVNPVSGDLVWDAPEAPGIYNIAMFIDSWKRGVKIGRILRDMQIDVRQSTNHPPVLDTLRKFCVEAGTLVSDTVVVTDPDKDNITLTATGDPFLLGSTRTQFNQVYSTNGLAKGVITWQTDCSDVRKAPHQFVIKAKDDYSPVSLVSFGNIQITVIAPRPKNLVAVPSNKSILLQWDKTVCSNAVGYKIYRRVGSQTFNPDSCTTGVPASLGYVQVGESDSVWNNSFLDNNNGNGLRQGYVYCYRVIAFFADGAQSYASDQVCTELKRGIPIMTNVSVTNTDEINGSIFVAWCKPRDFVTKKAGPFTYKVYRSNDLWGQYFTLVKDSVNFNDTIFRDTLINTKTSPYTYKVQFYNADTLIGSPDIASSIFLKIDYAANQLKINFQKNVPWLDKDTAYTIYRQNGSGFDSIGIARSSDTYYVDEHLKNNTIYCYKVKNFGEYMVGGIAEPIINFSHINCGKSFDTIPPCCPKIKVTPNCNALINTVSWNNPNLTCSISPDAIKYNIYYASTKNGKLALIDSITAPNAPDLTTYNHKTTTTLAGCYMITAVDSYYNESKHCPTSCQDICTDNFQLPNVFTPNGDGHNDYFVPIKNEFVNKIDCKIYNRWGNLVFSQTFENAKNFSWDGRDKSGHAVSDGVYYYVCDLYENRLTGVELRNIVGFVHVYASAKAKP